MYDMQFIMYMFKSQMYNVIRTFKAEVSKCKVSESADFTEHVSKRVVPAFHKITPLQTSKFLPQLVQNHATVRKMNDLSDRTAC